MLVVEDEDNVRRLVCETLRVCGYLVLEASSGAAALRAVERHGGRIDLVITDVVMPEMNGWDVAANVGRISVGTKVLFMSGHAVHPVLERRVSSSAVPLLTKPFTAHQLARAVREALDGRAAAA